MDLFQDYAKIADSQVDKSGLAYTTRQSMWSNKRVDTDDTIEYKRQLALMMYNNAYNSPSEQFDRLVAAGVSPFMAAKSVSGGVQGASTASAPAGTGLSQQENTRANIASLADLFTQSLNFANQIIGTIDNGFNVAFNSNSFDNRLSLIRQNEQLMSNKAGIAQNQNWLSALQNAALAGALGLGGYDGYGFGFNLQDLPPDTLSGITDFFQKKYGTELTQKRIEELDIKVNKILPEILSKYSLDNEQKEYINDVLKTLPPEVRAYIVLGMEAISTFMKPIDISKFLPSN